MQVVLLCGGLGTRFKEQTEFMPKPLARIGTMPILWHIMKMYSQFGHKDFVLCLGYKGEMIKDYFLNYKWLSNDFTMKLGPGQEHLMHTNANTEDWTITFAETGQHTLTSGRLKSVQKYIRDDDFLVTYGDGVADVNLDDVIAYHKKMGKVATITGLHLRSKYGIVRVKDDGLVYEFKEKPVMNDLINGGFMVMNKKIFNYLDLKKDCMLEEVFPILAKENELALYKHNGFFFAVDTQRDFEELNKIWDSGNPPWKNW
ncbi:MAG: sugar phosphate nucleotidyltransferase [Nanoarchaeota archaeon]